MRYLRTDKAEFESEWQELLRSRRCSLEEALEVARVILEEVKSKGDEAVVRFTLQFDHVDLREKGMEIPVEAWAGISKDVSPSLKEALLRAREQIESFCLSTRPRDWFEEKGGILRGELFRPVERVGVYVPGGKASYPSSVLMGVIPAKVAGVGEIVVVSPPPVDPLTVCACEVAGASRLFQIGGAQAIAALAFGTESVPRVDLIVGPGNRFVTAAKRLLYGEVGVDMLAGPSELLVIADKSADPRWVALDLLSQAEHDQDAWCVLMSPEEGLLKEVKRVLEGELWDFPRREIASLSLNRYGLLVQTKDLEEAFYLAGQFAPEHLSIQVEDPFVWLKKVKAAGSVFLGKVTSVVFGDYCGGPNHVLPTSGSARFSSALGVHTFLKRIQFLYVGEEALEGVSKVASEIALAEGLNGHARAAMERLYGQKRDL